jgi:hypothetical protein
MGAATQMKMRRTRGIALVTVMLALLFCLMMLGAFLQSNRNYLQLFRRGQAHDQATDSTRSVYEFARSSLEENKAWGVPSESDIAGSLGQDIEWLQHKRQGVGDRESRITGRLANGLVFRLDILNNLRTSATVDGVQPKMCRVKIRLFENRGNRPHKEMFDHPGAFVYAGGAEVMMRNAALYDSGVVASMDINLHAHDLSFHSKDPIRNQVRSNDSVRLSSGGELDFAFLTEVDPGEWQQYTPRGYDGTVWAKNDILLGDDVTTDHEHLAQTTIETNGQFIPNARTQYSIPELSSSDIATSGEHRELESGIYIFSQHWVEYGGGEKAQIPILARLSTSPTGERQLNEFYYMTESLGGAGDARLLHGNQENGAPVDTPGQGKEVTNGSDRFEMLDVDGSPTGLTVDLATRTIDIAPNLTLDVDGEFLVASADSVTSDDWNVNEQPVTVNFGLPGLEDADWNRSTIKTDSDIVIEGYVHGKGNLIAGRDVTLLPNEIDVEADTETDLAVFAGRDVNIYRPDNSAGEGKVAFNGLVYANRNFTFAANCALEVEGAIVAREGQVYLVAGEMELGEDGPNSVTGSKSLKVTYNPKYLDDLLQQTALERTKVELLAWRPGLND